jgi:hypothetical protein
LSNQLFKLAVLNVPDVDLLTPTTESRYIERCYIAMLYWTIGVCNTWGCKTPFGRQFVTFDEDCECCHGKLFFCSELCHNNRKQTPTSVGVFEDVPGIISCAGPGCFALQGQVMPCRDCYLPQYCSMECKKAHALAHSLRCCQLHSTIKENGRISSFLYGPQKK